MTALQVLPQADPLPLPAYPWMFLFLLYLTFSLHLIAMNLTIGGTLLLTVSSFRRSENMEKLSVFLSKFLPFSLSFTITLGVAPLLFIQVLYGQLFFTTSILMGWWWLMILVFLMIAYYSLYLYQHKRDQWPVVRTWAPLVSVVLMVIIALLFVMNLKLLCRYNEWKEIYTSGVSGWFLNFGHPLVFPTWTHHLLAAVAVGGILLVLHGWGRRSKDQAYADWAARTGGLMFVVPTIIQFAAGYWMLKVLPHELLKAYMFGSVFETTILFIAMGTGTLAALLIAWTAWKSRYGWPVVLSLVLIAATMALMVIKRAMVRDALLAGLEGFDISAMPVSPQWDTITIFAVLLVGGLAVVGWMLYVVFRGKREVGETTLDR